MRSRTLLLPILCAGLLPLAAQDFQLGVQGAVAFPGGDLQDAAGPGLQLGGHLRWNFGQGHGLMARVDWTSFGDHDGVSTFPAPPWRPTTPTISTAPSGVYLLPGCHADLPPGLPGRPVNNSGLGLDLGLGYDLDRHLGLQARMTSSSMDHATLSPPSTWASPIRSEPRPEPPAPPPSGEAALP